MPTTPKMKRAEIYMRNGSFYIRSQSKSTVGIFLWAGPIIVSEDSISAEALGRNILDAFAFSTENIPHPANSTEWSQNLKPFLEAAKVRSWKTFMNGAEAVALKNIDGTIELIPYINRGAKMGFDFNSEKIRVLSADCPVVELGETIKNMFQEITSESIL